MRLPDERGRSLCCSMLSVYDLAVWEASQDLDCSEGPIPSCRVINKVHLVSEEEHCYPA